MNWKLPDVQAVFRKGRGTRDQIANTCLIIEKAREFQKNTYFASLTTLKPLTVWMTTNCGKFLKRWDYQIILPVSWETSIQVKKQLEPCSNKHGTMDWFKIGQGVCQAYILSYCLFNLYAEYIMQNARLYETQAGIKIARGNINSLRYTDDKTLIA